MLQLTLPNFLIAGTGKAETMRLASLLDSDLSGWLR